MSKISNSIKQDLFRAVDNAPAKNKKTEVVDTKVTNQFNSIKSAVNTAKANSLKATSNNVKFALVNKLQQQTLTADQAVQAATDRVVKEAKNDPQKGAETLVNEINSLKAKYGPEAAAKLIEELNKQEKNGKIDLTNVLKFASYNNSSQNVTSPQQAIDNSINMKNLADAVGGAYNNMSAEDKQQFVQNLTAQVENDGFSGHFLDPVNPPTFIADLVAAGSNNDLKKDMVASLVARGSDIGSGWLGNNGGVDIKNLYNSAAIIAGSGDKASQVEMFNTIIQSFPALADDSKQLNSIFEDKTFKDKMSQIFLNNSQEILSSLTANNGRFNDSKSLDGLVKFFEMALFSKNPGDLRDAVKGELISNMSQLANGSSTNGRTATSQAYMAGSLLGALQSAAINQKDAIKDSQKEREETAKFFVGLGFSFVPGADKVLGEGAEKALEVAYDKAKDFAKDNTESAISGFINNMLDGDTLKNINTIFNELRDLKFKIASGLPENLADAFGNGYTETGVDQLFLRALNR